MTVTDSLTSHLFAPMNDAPMTSQLENVDCPLCLSSRQSFWCEEDNFNVVRCVDCRLLYVSPRLGNTEIEAAVDSGEHYLAHRRLNVRSRHLPRKVKQYERILRVLFRDLWISRKAILWVDIGCGYGETIEALSKLAPTGSRIKGIEPMEYKARHAQKRGLDVINSYLAPSTFEADVISCVDIFSHIPDFRSFLIVVASNLKSRGELFIETGNLADLKSRHEFTNELGLPDHLVFAGQDQLIRYLREAGFEVVEVQRHRTDGLVDFVKNVVKKLIGRHVKLALPYTSAYRQLRVRARRQAL